MEDRTCVVDGCDKPRYQGRRMCSTHVMRKHRYGDPLVHRSRAGNEWTTSNGYVKRFIGHGHPLADAKGCTYIHREVLYGGIGLGPHPCHWCGTHVDWVSWTDGQSWSGVLLVDHLDGNKNNNQRDNLVPTCFSCNALRGRWGDAAVIDRQTR